MTNKITAKKIMKTGLTQREFSEESGIPYYTLISAIRGPSDEVVRMAEVTFKKYDVI